jgi:glycine oxidase
MTMAAVMPEGSGMAIADVTVRGAGIFGLCIAWSCAQRGARVRLIDPNGAGSGASGGIVGALAPHTPDQWNEKKQFQFEALLMAEAFWAEISAVSGLPTGYRRTGRIQPIAEEITTLARNRGISAESNWKGLADWRVETGRWGWQVRDTLSAHLHPRLAVAALVRALGAQGIVVEPEAEDSGKTVHATGWQGLVASAFGTGEKGQALLLAHDRRGEPQVFADALHIIGHEDGTTAIGSTSERSFDSPATVDTLCDDLLARALLILPELSNARVLERWAGVRPRAKNRAPLLGPWPDRPGHVIANGGYKIGFGVAPKVGEVIAELVLEGRTEIPRSFLAPEFRMADRGGTEN